MFHLIQYKPICDSIRKFNPTKPHKLTFAPHVAPNRNVMSVEKFPPVIYRFSSSTHFHYQVHFRHRAWHVCVYVPLYHPGAAERLFLRLKSKARRCWWAVKIFDSFVRRLSHPGGIIWGKVFHRFSSLKGVRHFPRVAILSVGEKRNKKSKLSYLSYFVARGGCVNEKRHLWFSLTFAVMTQVSVMTRWPDCVIHANMVVMDFSPSQKSKQERFA